MAGPRREWLKLIVEVLAAASRVRIQEDTALPYSPAVLEAMANSGKALH